MPATTLRLKPHQRLPAIAGYLSLLAYMMVSYTLHAQDPPVAKEKTSGTMIRILCVSCLDENEEVVLASKTQDGKWLEQGAVKLRSSFISSWMKISAGEIFLARREATGLVSIGSFQLGENSKRAILILLPDSVKKGYQVDAIDLAKLDFRKGTALITNYSKLPALVMLGNKKAQVMPGGRVTEKAQVGQDGMYRMLVGYQNNKKELVPCYDRYIAANPDARDFLLLFPDPTAVLKVYSLSEFGPFE